MAVAWKDKLIRKIKEKRRILSEDEAFDFYINNVMRNEPTCFLNRWHNKGRGKYEDYELWQLTAKARTWHKMTIGSLVVNGEAGFFIQDW